MQKLKTYIFFQVFNGAYKLYIIDLKSQILSINCMHYEIIFACFLAHLILVHYFLRSYLPKIA